MPELLAPAGSFDKLEAALLYGADAVYLAGDAFGMRAAAQNFAPEELFRAFDYAHARGKKVYLTVNTMPRGYEYSALREYLSGLAANPPDGLIIADIGVLALARELLPKVEAHISTQASIVSSAAARAWQAAGATRVVLARELTLDEIKRIREEIPPGLEIEVFIHGSMCVSYSGRCLLSNHFTGRDSNRGQCAQPCRWEYGIYPAFEIAECEKPLDRLPVYEDKRGTFIMSSKDLCMIEHIPELTEAGIDSFKIEGRMKSAYYAAVVTNAYRMAMDAYAKDPAGYKFDEEWARELDSVSHREYATGYFFDEASETAQITTTPGYIREKSYIATLLEYDEASGLATFVQRNKLSRGERAELITPGRAGRAFDVEAIYGEDGAEIESAPHPAMKFKIKLPFAASAGDILRSADRG